MMKRLAAAALLALSACSGQATAGTAEPRIALAASTYRFPPVGTLQVAFTVVNGGAVPVSVPACGGRPAITVDRGEGGEWRQLGSLVCQANLPMAPVTLPAGRTLEGTVQFGVAGAYRLRLPLVGGGEIRSGRFTLRAGALP
jgi:hypothetical protein